MRSQILTGQPTDTGHQMARSEWETTMNTSPTITGIISPHELGTVLKAHTQYSLKRSLRPKPWKTNPLTTTTMLSRRHHDNRHQQTLLSWHKLSWRHGHVRCVHLKHGRWRVSIALASSNKIYNNTYMYRKLEEITGKIETCESAKSLLAFSWLCAANKKLTTAFWSMK